MTVSSPVFVWNSLPLAPTMSPDIPLLEFLVDTLRESVTLEANLDLARAILELDKTGLAHDTLHHHAAGDGDVYVFLGERIVRVRSVHVLQLFRERIAMEVVRERVAALAQCIELLASLRDQLVFVERFFVCHALQSLFQARFDEAVQPAIEHGLSVTGFYASAQILDTALVEHVRTNLAAPAHVRLAFLDR